MEAKKRQRSESIKLLRTSSENELAWQKRFFNYKHFEDLNQDLVLHLALVADLSAVYCRRPRWDRLAKRILDLSMSLFALILLSPVFIVVPILIRLTSRGPALFTQQRVGLFGEPFKIYKFRTMFEGAEALNVFSRPMQKLSRDPRSTRFGSFLREWRVDELPQILNVFLGQMSWVGPRPLVIEESSICPEECLFRFAAKPGLTGLWQATFSNRISGLKKLKLDADYAVRQSLWLDIKLMLLTVPRMFRRESKAQSPHLVDDANESV